jgi:hypothetical protein
MAETVTYLYETAISVVKRENGCLDDKYGRREHRLLQAWPCRMARGYGKHAVAETLEASWLEPEAARAAGGPHGAELLKGPSR